MKTSVRVIFILTLTLVSYQQVSAKCGGACISIDSIGNSIHQTDTAYLKAGDLLKIYAKYDQNCMYLIAPQFPQMELVFYRNGIPFDTTSIEDATYDNIWTWYTHIYIDQPGLYEVYFIGYYQPDYPCKKILVLDESEEVSQGPLPAAMENHSNTGMDFMIYPNPSKDGIIHIAGKELEYATKIEVLDVAGSKVFDAMPNSGGTLQIPTENFHRGLYMIRIEYRGTSFIQKVVVN
jgi:hypothetical protein